MIDVFSIVISTVFVVFVIFRAYVANKTEVWFTATPTPEASKDRKVGRDRPSVRPKRS